jgi:ADP-ribose pyrophosphatase YjhB (NUDIX family)
MSDYDRQHLASDFQVLPGEAVFPPVIRQELVGGAHIAVECITRQRDEFLMTIWPRGLPRHDTHRTTRFPHGLMLFGESISDCVRRLVADQLGMTVSHHRVIHIDSYTDEQNHWHIEPWVLVDVDGVPSTPTDAAGVVRFQGDELPSDALWSAADFREVLQLISPAERTAPQD